MPESELRERANECFEHAKARMGAREKAIFLSLAEAWLDLARQREVAAGARGERPSTTEAGLDEGADPQGRSLGRGEGVEAGNLAGE